MSCAEEQEILDADVRDGFVIGLKRRREFAVQLCEDYKRFTDPQKLELVLALAVDLGVQDLSLMVKTLPSIKRSGLVLSVLTAALGFSRKNDPNISKSIKRGLVPLAEQLFLLVGTIPQGPKFLLKLRVDLGRLVKKYGADLPADSVEALEFLDMVMRDLFATQAGMRFLRIDLSSEKLIGFVLKHERVHAIRNWTDLERRIAGPQRFCFGLFHTHMSAAPLAFVEVLVTDHLSDKIAPILEQDSPVVTDPTHIIFYSVSSSNSGLRGLNIGSHLLFLTIQRMSSMFPRSHTSATLSPVPGFDAWFRAVLASADSQLQQTGHKQRHQQVQRGFFTQEQAQSLTIKYGVNHLVLHKWLLKRLGDPEWYKDDDLLESIRDVITAACARYVLFERKGDKILDPVANFHLQNGAQVEQINFLADMSPKALSTALGTMINYRYCMTSVDVTSVSYKRKSLAAVSPSVVRLIWPSSNIVLDGEYSRRRGLRSVCGLLTLLMDYRAGASQSHPQHPVVRASVSRWRDCHGAGIAPDSYVFHHVSAGMLVLEDTCVLLCGLTIACRCSSDLVAFEWRLPTRIYSVKGTCSATARCCLTSQSRTMFAQRPRHIWCCSRTGTCKFSRSSRQRCGSIRAQTRACGCSNSTLRVLGASYE